jgi:hypothetical protein
VPELRDRAAAIGAELHELRNDAAIAGDEQLLSLLREADRLFMRHFGNRDQAGNSYEAVKRRVEQELHLDYARDLQTIQQRYENQYEEIRREFEEQRALELELENSSSKRRRRK